MRPTDPDEHRTRFRRPLGVAVMAYKAALGLSEIVVGILLAVHDLLPRPGMFVGDLPHTWEQ